MKTSAPGKIDPSLPAASRSQRGIALVVVLIFLVLLTVLVLAFFSSVTSEYTSSKTYANEASTKLLSDSAVNIVMGQIAKGTQGQAAGATARLTWASQPGMIRTYDDSGNPGSANNLCYKLYSSSNMVIQSSSAVAAIGVGGTNCGDVPASWNTQPAIYTDLNAPVMDASGTWNFPIMEGNNLNTLSGSNIVTYCSSGGTAPFIEGISVNPATVPVTGYNPAVISSTNNPVPMPVQWLYTLRDGTLITPDSGGNGTNATFVNSAVQPSATNPIVGRIAFWTDDETCKLNINTASEGTDYAFPHVNTNTEMSSTAKGGSPFGFAISPPATGEYNRYPGHPATTCLSVALGHWLDGTYTSFVGRTRTSGIASAPTAYSSTLNDTTYFGLNSGSIPSLSSGSFFGLSAYTLLAPRVKMSGSAAGGVGGSLAGTVNESGSLGANAVSSGSDRLYASLDELLFRYPAVGDSAPRTAFPNPNLSGTLAKPAFEMLKFFLTADSRAPELTPFNTPKVSMWPQWMYVPQRNTPSGTLTGAGLKPTEALLAFCSSFGTSASAPSGRNEYFIQRYQDIVNGIQTNAGWRSSHVDWDLVPRNQQVANYIYRLGSTPIPGYGGSLAPLPSSSTATTSSSKYSKTAFSNLIIESIDTIRCTDWADYQTVDGNVYNGINSGALSNVQTMFPLEMTGTNTSTMLLPTDSGTDTLKGFGTHPVCTQVVLALTLNAGYITTGTLLSAGTLNGSPIPQGTVIQNLYTGGTSASVGIQPTLYFQVFFPNLSLVPPCSSFILGLDHIESLGIPYPTGTYTGPWPSGTMTGNNIVSWETYSGAPVTEPIQILSSDSWSRPLPVCPIPASGTVTGAFATPAGNVPMGTYPVASGTTFHFGSSGTATFTFYDANGYDQPLQNYSVYFPSITLPLPTAYGQSVSTGSTCTARGVECSGTGVLNGDWRLLACLYNAGQISGTNIFTESNPMGTASDYYNNSYTQVHTLRPYSGGDMLDPGGSHRFTPYYIDGTAGGPSSSGSGSGPGSGPLPFYTGTMGNGTPNVYVAGALVSSSTFTNTSYEDYTAPCAPAGMKGATMILNGSGTAAGDWDTGPGLMPDGPYINPQSMWNYAGTIDYFYQQRQGNYNMTGLNTTVFSPNRMVSSPVSFGSLPTGADPNNPQPWQTLLFCPNPAARTTLASGTATATTDHIGFGNPYGSGGSPTPPDSIYLEFFTMPVVQPYAMSEPLSTAGKVNLNYQLAPFTYIERSTALRGVLKNTLISAINPADVAPQNSTHPTPIDGSNQQKYKFYLNTKNTTSGTINMASPYAYETRYNINRDATVAGIDEHYFNNGLLFRYPSEVCGVFLVPLQIPSGSYNPSNPALPTTYDSMMSWWSQMTLTGDNLREEPYDRIYPRLTTKSNSYTVHYRVQTLKKISSSNQNEWDEGRDVVTAEYRGSSLIERYVDPNDPAINSNWDNDTMSLNLSGTNHADLSTLYRFRVISTKQFAP